VDITVYQVQEDNSLKELYKVSDSACGGIQVDEAFKQMVIKITGSNVYFNFCDKHAADFVDMFREFESKKICFSGKEKQISIKIPYSLIDTFEEETDENIQEVLSQSSYSGKMKLLGDKLRINSDLFATLFDVVTKNIVEHLNNVLQEPEVKGTTNIIMVGEFSESYIIQDKVGEAFPNMTVIIPTDAGLSVMKGAVIFGHENN
jgi:molecular chaperone DnaK (HSP70)